MAEVAAKARTKVMHMKKYIINLSGHPLSDTAKKTAKKYARNTIDIPVPNADLTNLDPYTENIMKTMKKNKSLANAILTNDFVVIVPGHSGISNHLLSALHGASGTFPVYTFTYKNGDVFDLAPLVDLQEIRLKFRDFFRN